ncbi:MAG TPA: hypothetical protein VG674_16165 [Amycolatopsis sp.]|nr:hypothetical protein [Amycolatopsis sp.]
MAVKITHLTNGQQVRFANTDDARHYAELLGGGVDKWSFTDIPGDAQLPLEPGPGSVVHVPVWRTTAR